MCTVLGLKTFLRSLPKRFRGRVPLCGLVLIALVLTWSNISGLASETLSLPKKYADAVQQLAQFMDAPTYDASGTVLKMVGYDHPGINDEDWRAYPAVRKIETAYLSADAAATGGGERMLALLSSALAQQYESAGNLPELRDFVHKAQQQGITEVKFQAIDRKPGDKPPTLSPSATKLIAAVSHFCASGVYSPQVVLTHYLQLDPDTAYDIMRTSSTHTEMIKRGFEAARSDSQRDRAMVLLVRNLDRDYESARKVEAFEPWRAKDERVDAWTPSSDPFRWTRPFNPDPPFPGSGPKRGPEGPGGSRGQGSAQEWPGPISPRPPVPPTSLENSERPNLPVPPSRSPDWRQSRAADYRAFMRREYPSAPSRTFRSASRSARGFGGVVFGSDISGPDVSQNSSLLWIRGGDGTSAGTLEWRWDSGKAVLNDVNLENIYAAYRIVYGWDDLKGIDADAAAEGDVIGLVGIKDAIPYFDCGATRMMHEGTRWHVVMHPALVNMSLGWSVLMCDAIPLSEVRPGFLNHAKESKGKDFAERLERVWDLATTTWKYSDVPMKITFHDGRILVERDAASGSSFPEKLRQTAFITFNAFSDKVVEEASAAFYPLVPELTTISADYNRLNDFARVLAVVRAAKTKGANFSEIPPEPTKRPVAASVITTKEGIAPAAAYKRSEALQELIDKARLCVATLESNDSELQKAGATMADLSGQAKTTLDELKKAAPRFQEIRSKLASEHMRHLVRESTDNDLKRRYEELQKEREEQEVLYFEAARDSNEERQAAEKLRSIEKKQLDLAVGAFPGLKTAAEEAKSIRRKAEEASQLFSKMSDPGALLPQPSRNSPQAKYWVQVQQELAKAQLDLWTAQLP
jgi:hypothetical protein